MARLLEHGLVLSNWKNYKNQDISSSSHLSSHLHSLPSSLLSLQLRLSTYYTNTLNPRNILHHNSTVQGISLTMVPHPFKILSLEETRTARDIVLSLHPDVVVDFREIFLQEPEKELMKQYLALEHAAKPGQSPASQRVPRLAKVLYDVVGSDKIPEYHESLVDVQQKKRVRHEVVGKEKQATLTLWEFQHLVQACKESEEFQKAIAEFKLPDGFELVVEPW